MGDLQLTYTPLQGELLQRALPNLPFDCREALLTKKGGGIAALFRDTFAGSAVFDLLEGRMVLRHIFVEAGFRRSGIGTALLRKLCEMADARGIDLLFSFLSAGFGTPFHRFVSSTRLFTLERQAGYSVVLTAEDMRAVFEKYPAPASPPTRFFEQSRVMRAEFAAHIKATFPSIARELGTHHGYREDLSLCAVEGGQIAAACLVTELGGELELKLLYAREGKSILAGKMLIRFAGLLARLDPCPSVRFTPVGAAATRIAEGFCPTMHIEDHVYTAYYTGNLT